MSAFSVFFTQSPSFLDFQERMQKKYNQNNAQSIFGVHRLPSTTQICTLLDPIPPETLYPVLAHVGDQLYHAGCLDAFRSIDNTLLIAFDGTDSDCELAAAKRWLVNWGAHYADRRITVLGDDLYCHQPFCQAVLEQKMDFLLVCKPDSHSLLYEWVADFERTGQVQTVEATRWTGKQRITECYRFINHVPLRDSDDALHVNWCEVTLKDSNQKVTYRNAWVTTHEITPQNVQGIVAAGRARWKIENENNNVLKNHGYHFEHNFSHGKQHLANLLTTLNLLAFLLHTALEWMDEAYRKVRHSLPSRRTFFEQLWTVLQLIPFNSWEHFIIFMLDGQKIIPRKT